MSGTIAFRKLEALAKPANLRKVFARLNAAAKPTDRARLTSCYATMIAVAKTLTNQPISTGNDAGMVSGGRGLVCQGQSTVQTSEIMKYLDEGCLVAISLGFKKSTDGGKGMLGGDDHHFAVFALDKETVVAAMAWEKHYDLTQWFLGRKQGLFTRDRFEDLMTQIENGSSRAVVELCAFIGASQRDGQSIPMALRKEVDGWRPVSQAMAFKLPST